MILWFLRLFGYVRDLEATVDCLTVQLMETKGQSRTAQEIADKSKGRAFKLKLGWHQIAQREAAKRNTKEQRIAKLAKELEQQ